MLCIRIYDTCSTGTKCIQQRTDTVGKEKQKKNTQLKFNLTIWRISVLKSMPGMNFIQLVLWCSSALHMQTLKIDNKSLTCMAPHKEVLFGRMYCRVLILLIWDFVFFFWPFLSILKMLLNFYLSYLCGYASLFVYISFFALYMCSACEGQKLEF